MARSRSKKIRDESVLISANDVAAGVQGVVPAPSPYVPSLASSETIHSPVNDNVIPPGADVVLTFLTFGDASKRRQQIKNGALHLSKYSPSLVKPYCWAQVLYARAIPGIVLYFIGMIFRFH